MGKRHYRKYTDDDVRRVAAEVRSLAGLLSGLGLKVAGGNFANMKRILQRLEVDTSHWTGQAWSKGERLKDWSQYTRASKLKPHLIKDRGYECEGCHLTEWRDVPIPLEIDHKNGDRTDNRLENLELLCCNCHALTDTWRGRKNGNKYYCSKCGSLLSAKRKTGLCGNCYSPKGHKKTKTSKIIITRKCRDCGCDVGRRAKTERCLKCSCKSKRKTERPTKKALESMIQRMSWTAIGRKFGVSDNAVRKWARQYDLLE